MYFIRAFGFVGVDIFKEFFHTTDLYIDVLHLMKGAWAFIRYGSVCDRSKLFVESLIQDI